MDSSPCMFRVKMQYFPYLQFIFIFPGTKKETSFDDDLSLSRDYLLKLQSPNVNVPVATAGSYLTTDKLNSIISFLDEVEKVEEDVRSEVLRVS